jgi:hypothetical protein
MDTNTRFLKKGDMVTVIGGSNIFPEEIGVVAKVLAKPIIVTAFSDCNYPPEIILPHTEKFKVGLGKVECDIMVAFPDLPDNRFMHCILKEGEAEEERKWIPFPSACLALGARPVSFQEQYNRFKKENQRNYICSIPVTPHTDGVCPCGDCKNYATEYTWINVWGRAYFFSCCAWCKKQYLPGIRMEELPFEFKTIQKTKAA